MTVEFLPAFNGDCILINSFMHTSTNILIDGGISKTYPSFLKKRLRDLVENKEYIDLLIITHIDDDHIGGILKIFEDTKFDISNIKAVWFNSGVIISKYFDEITDSNRELKIIPNNTKDMSIRQGITLEKILKHNNIWDELVKKSLDVFAINDFRITVLSPEIKDLYLLNKYWNKEKKSKNMSGNINKKYSINLKLLTTNKFIEDNSVTNKSSIALLIENFENKIMLLGDAPPSSVINSLFNLNYSETNPIKIDLLKISHHGSLSNTSLELLRMVKCKNYLFSTDGSNHEFPHKEVFARILSLQNDVCFYFNYKNKITTSIFTDEDFEDFTFKCIYSEDFNYQILLK